MLCDCAIGASVARTLLSYCGRQRRGDILCCVPPRWSRIRSGYVDIVDKLLGTPTAGHSVERTARDIAADGFSELARAELDEAWYFKRYPDAAELVKNGEFGSALDHYVRQGATEGRSPNADFDEAYYLTLHNDVQDAVRTGRMRCGFEHYLGWGRKEGRVAKPPADLICTFDSCQGPKIDGWAANFRDPTEQVEIDVSIDGHVLARVRADRARRDLLSVLPNAEHGFLFEIPLAYCDGVPHRVEARDVRGRNLLLKEGPSAQVIEHLVFQYRYDDNLRIAISAEHRLEQIAHQLEEVRRELSIVRELTSLPMADYEHYFRRFYTLGSSEISELRTRAATLDYQPLISVVLPVYETRPKFLAEAIESVLRQAYTRWELCIADDASSDEGLRELIRSRAQRDGRIKYSFAEENAGLASNTNRALRLATGDYVAFLDHDDLLTADALYCVALALQQRRYGLLYSDEDVIDVDGRHLRPHFKPTWNYELMLAENYVCHLLVLERSLVEELGGLRHGFDGCQDRDLVLRAYEAIGETSIRHIPRVLYHWRTNPSSVHMTEANRDGIVARSVKCVQEHLDRTAQKATALAGDAAFYTCRVRWSLPVPQPRISIIVPTKDRLDLLAPCITSLLERTSYSNAHVVIVNHDSTDPATLSYLDVLSQGDRVTVLDYSGEFNWSALNNFAAARTEGDVLCFLNNDVLVIEPDWLDELVSHALRPEVGAVGAKLLYADGTVQHAGIVLGPGGFAAHAFQRLPRSDGGYLGRASCVQRVSAVTGACLVCRRDVFEELGGFDAIDFAIGLNDVDFCLRLQERGYCVVWTPHSVLYHFESKSRGYDDAAQTSRTRLAAEAARLRARWQSVIDRDPHYNPHFDATAPPYERLALPKRLWSSEDCLQSEPPRRAITSDAPQRLAKAGTASNREDPRDALRDKTA